MAGPGAGAKALTVVFVSVLSWYTGLKFWKPIVIEHLKQEDRLRTDIEIDYDENEQPKSWEDLRNKVKESLHPDSKKEGIVEAANGNLKENLKVIEELKKEK